jgi:hypothetical protein
MHIARLLLIVAVALPFGACMSPTEIAADDDAACRSAGAKPGTSAYVKCRENRSNQRVIAQREGERSMQRMQWEMNQSAMRASMPRM